MRFYIVFIFSMLFACFYGKTNSYQFNKCNTNVIDTASYSNILDTLNGKIRGECYNISVNYANETKTYSNVMNWLSVPYAEPPIKENRFKNPVPKKNWENVIDGTTWPKACTQRFSSTSKEDCLFLNIFVKQDIFVNRNKSLVPILFFIHGGGLVGGETAMDYYESSTLAAYGDIIVVTIQYRLDLFGFLHLTDSLAKGNQGFLDQNLALKWVFENADRFGGDRTRITICGESSGAASVGYHLIYEKSWPYFRNAIMESGGPNPKQLSLISAEVANNRSKDLLTYLGCKGTPNEIVQCAQNIDANLILDTSYSYLRKKIFINEESSYIHGTHFPVVISNETFSESIEEIIEKKKFKKCKIITGFNSGDFAIFLYSLTNLGTDPSKWEQNAKSMNSSSFLNNIDKLFYYHPRYPLLKSYNFNNDLMKIYLPNSNTLSKVDYFKSLVDITTDFMFSCPTFQMAETFTKSDMEAYVYLYDHKISSSIYPEVYGAVHMDELPMLFAETLSDKKQPIISDNMWSSAYHNYSASQRKFNQDFLNYWLNFIKYDDPNYKLSQELSKWNSFIDSSKKKLSWIENSQYLFLKSNAIEMKTGFASHQCEFWKYTNRAAKKSEIFSLKYLIVFYVFFKMLL